MPDDGYVAAVVAVSAVITWGLRAVPFVALAPLRDSAVVRHLGTHMPMGVMVVLAAYTLHGIDMRAAASLAPFAAALLVTVALHLWRGSALVSIVGGMSVHVVIVTILVRS